MKNIFCQLMHIHRSIIPCFCHKLHCIQLSKKKKKINIVSSSILRMFITYYDTLRNTSSGFIEKEILKNPQVQPKILQILGIFLKKNSRNDLYLKKNASDQTNHKTHSKNHTTKKGEKLTARGSSNTSY